MSTNLFLYAVKLEGLKIKESVLDFIKISRIYRFQNVTITYMYFHFNQVGIFSHDLWILLLMILRLNHYSWLASTATSNKI